MTEPRWLAHAWQTLGQREVPGSKHNARILAMFRDVGHSRNLRDETPWCAAFVGACLERANVRSTRSLMARSYLDWGEDARAMANPIGAIAILSRGTNPTNGHVGFLVGENQKRIWLLGGNQGDAVSVSSFPRSRLLGLRWSGRVDVPASELGDGSRVFDVALAHVLKMEGGFTDDPVDPGGPTNKGITIGVLASWRKVRLSSKTHSRLLSELKSISDDTVRAIYFDRYWRKGSCDVMPAPVALMHFDACVNHGVGTAIRMLQKVVIVDVDGEIGPNTIAGVRAMPVAQVIATYARIRETRYRSLKHFWRFGRGWLNRVAATVERAKTLKDLNYGERDQDMANQATKTITNGTKWWGNSITIWGALITAAATVVPALAQSAGVELSPEIVRDVGTETMTLLQAIAGLAGTVATIYGRFRASDQLVRTSVHLKL